MGRRGPKPKRLVDRFHAGYEVDFATGCWIWTRSKDRKGYGRLANFDAVLQRWAPKYAHRVSYELFHGEIPDGLVVDHMCNTPSCVNPDHLQVLTNRANILRSSSPYIVAYWTKVCLRGHDVSLPENQYIRPDNGKVMCRECSRFRARRQSSRRSA